MLHIWSTGKENWSSSKTICVLKFSLFKILAESVFVCIFLKTISERTQRLGITPLRSSGMKGMIGGSSLVTVSR